MVLERLDSMDGRGRVVIELARQLCGCGDEVEVVCSEATVADLPLTQVHRVWTPVWLPWSLRTLWFAVLSAWVVGRRRQAVDLVHAHAATLAEVDVVTCHGLHRAGIGVAEQMPNPAAWGMRPSDLRRLRWLLPILEAPLRRSRAKVIALTRNMAVELQRECGVAKDRLAVIANGVDESRFASIRAAREQRLKRREQDRGAEAVGPARSQPAVQLLFVGHDFKRKGLAVALDLLAQWPQAELTVVGGDPNDSRITPRMEARAAALGVRSRVRFLGPCDTMERVYAAADLLLAPSAYEGFCLAVLEALACGIPVVGSPAALPEELGEDGPALRRIACQSPIAEWGQCARELARGAPAEVWNHARWVIARLSWERCASETRRLYLRSRGGCGTTT